MIAAWVTSNSVGLARSGFAARARVAGLMSHRFEPGLMSRHAEREARRESIPLALVELTYEDPDARRHSSHDELREIRTRWFGEQGIEIVVDTEDGRVISVWRKGSKP
jgi:hypothetical protein